ncbi:sulfite exporter TauE/SafE family protein [Cupriavidus sp. WS]|uniref:sulfite exporter TauE/SafE family protein n=1 Tax=Cupriavidus sp. WS TaxID=1312922 RepID=UPI000380A529|nr:sulfite exporter TauE/SafE family protein [Cupriavidus sp. WS]
MDASAFAVLAAVTAVAGIAKGLTGFGAALIMTPLFALVVAPAQAAMLTVLLHGLTAWQGIRACRRRVAWRKVAVLAAIALCAHQLALLGLGRVEPHLLRRGIGTLVLVMGVMALLGLRIRHGGGAVATGLAGVASGVFTALGGLGGPPVVYYFSGQGTIDASVRANLLAYFMLLFAGASLGLLAQGRLDLPTVRAGALLVPFFCAGAVAGEALFARLPSAVFARVVQLALITIGAFSVLG